MNIYEYQAKQIFKTFGVNVPNGKIAYTPTEAKNIALEISQDGPWVVKAQILAGSRDEGKFFDKRAGKKGGIRISKDIQDVFLNTNEMLNNTLITNKTSEKGLLVSRVYVEEFIKIVKKFYFGLVIDNLSACTYLIITEINESANDIIDIALNNPAKILKLNLGLQKEIKLSVIEKVIEFMRIDINSKELKSFINKMLKIFYKYDATMLEINPIGISKNDEIWALDAKINFDEKSLFRQPEITKLQDVCELDYKEQKAKKFGFQYQELNSGIGIIVNGDGLALNIINEAQKHDLDTACFLNLKGGVDRDKIAESIKLIMSSSKVDGIFINILGGFLRCNLIADGILTVANDLGLNIPLVVRFEGTNKDEAKNILNSSNLNIVIVEDVNSGLLALKQAIKEDL